MFGQVSNGPCKKAAIPKLNFCKTGSRTRARNHLPGIYLLTQDTALALLTDIQLRNGPDDMELRTLPLKPPQQLLPW